jgi:phospholipid transport system substrate-binding protein
MTSYSLLAVLSLGTFAAREERSAADPPSPTAEIRRSADALRRTLSRRYPRWSPEAEAQVSSVQAVIDGIFDFDEIARRSMGQHWTRISAADQRDFVGLLQRIIERRPMESGLRLEPESAIAYQREQIAEGDAVVPSVISVNSSTRHQVAYKMTFKEGHWRIYDIVVDGVSLVDEYHAQFSRIIARDGFPGVMRRMRRKLGDGQLATGAGLPDPMGERARQGM